MRAGTVTDSEIPIMMLSVAGQTGPGIFVTLLVMADAAQSALLLRKPLVW